MLRHHPQVVENDHLAVVNAALRPFWVDAVPWTFEGTPAGPVVVGGLQGEHSEAIRDELGLDR